MEKGLFGNRGVERGTVFQLAAVRSGRAVHDGAGQDVGTDFGAFLDQADT
jgi:hypothetical protein